MDLPQKVQEFLQTRAYCYKRTFSGAVADTVLRDLAKFCRAHESTFNPDPRLAAMLDGRREVWLRIQQHLNLSDEEIMQLFGGHNG